MVAAAESFNKSKFYRGVVRSLPKGAKVKEIRRAAIEQAKSLDLNSRREVAKVSDTLIYGAISKANSEKDVAPESDLPVNGTANWNHVEARMIGTFKTSGPDPEGLTFSHGEIKASLEFLKTCGNIDRAHVVLDAIYNLTKEVE